MFNFLKKEKNLSSVANGRIIGLSKVPDQVFSQKILGDGFAVVPTNGNFFSPIDGTITDVTETLHAYCITSRDGLEILVHIGIDTVELKGEFFTSLVKKGDPIHRGEAIALADIDAIKEKGYNTTTMVVITNTEKLKEFRVLEAPSAKAGSPALAYKL